MSEPFIGEIRMFGGTFAPRNWAFCNGQLLAISSNTALFSILGTTYGGDGRTTFGLPDLRGRVPINSGGGSTGPGLSPRPLGQKGGEETHTLNLNEIPSHNHTASLNAEGVGASTNNPQDNYLGLADIYAPASGRPDRPLHANSVTTLNTGGSLSHNNMQPYLAVNFIIALFGLFPSRN